MKDEIHLTKQELIQVLLKEDLEISSIAKKASSINELRELLFEYLNNLERSYFNVLSYEYTKDKHIIKHC